MTTLAAIRARPREALTQEFLRAEIEARQQQISRCVGWLYPSILDSEIDELCALLASAVPGGRAS